MVEFIVLTYPKNHHICLDILDTWGKDKSILFLSDLETSHNIKYFGGKTGYQNIYTKYIALFRDYTPMSDWIVFCDDDTYVNTINLDYILTGFDSNKNLCIGRIGELKEDCVDDKGNPTGFPLKSLSGFNTKLPILYPSGGAGFVISKQTFLLIKDVINKDPESAYNSDVAIGFWMRRCGTYLVDFPGFYWTSPDKLGHTKEKITEAITYHYVTNHRELHNEISRGREVLHYKSYWQC